MRRAVFILVLTAVTPALARAQRASYEELQTFSAVMNLIRLNHVDSVSYTPLVRAAIEGALGAVDPHSRYVRRDIEAQLIAARSGEAGSAGVELDGMGSVVAVIAVGSGSPAEHADMLAGDRILAVQDSPVAGLAAHEVEVLLSGRPGTERRVTVERGDPLTATRVDLVIRLDRYAWPNIATPMIIAGDIGYVRLSGFDVRAASELERALDGLRGRGMKRLVLDLRGNPGGLLSEAVSVAGLFLPKNALVMRTKGRKVDANQEYRTRSGGRYQDLPMVVLVDGSSASAAEALAGALQDHGRGIVAGHRTFGKALVQMPFPLPAGDVLWLTVARVHTPDGRMIQRSYEGLAAAQYAAASDALRRGGATAAAAGSGGIEPDSYFDARAVPPGWWPDARRQRLDVQAVERARLTTGPGADGAAWRTPLLDALRTVVVETLGVDPVLEPAQDLAIGRHLLHTAIEMREGRRAAGEFSAINDPEVLRAASLLDPRPPR
ncbi:MAG TPA: S41 family peptidase [Longimicrobiales bacterium]|nr:S41 family peptidase [Longimicrobiales bacterium]